MPPPKPPKKELKPYIFRPNEWVVATAVLALTFSSRLLFTMSTALGYGSFLVPYENVEDFRAVSTSTMYSGAYDYEEIGKRLDHYCRIDLTIFRGAPSKRSSFQFGGCDGFYSAPLASALGLPPGEGYKRCSDPQIQFVDNSDPDNVKCLITDEELAAHAEDFISKEEGSGLLEPQSHSGSVIAVPNDANDPQIMRPSATKMFSASVQAVQSRRAETILEPVRPVRTVAVRTADVDEMKILELKWPSCMVSRLFYRMQDALQDEFSHLDKSMRSSLLNDKERRAMIRWYLSSAIDFFKRPWNRYQEKTTSHISYLRPSNYSDIKEFFRGVGESLRKSVVCEGDQKDDQFCTVFLSQVLDVVEGLDGYSMERLHVEIKANRQYSWLYNFEMYGYKSTRTASADLLRPHLYGTSAALITPTCRRALEGADEARDILEYQNEAWYIFLTRLLPSSLSAIYFISLLLLSSSSTRKRLEAKAKRRRRQIQLELQDPMLRRLLEKRAAATMSEKEVQEMIQRLSDFASEDSNTPTSARKWNSRQAAARVVLRKLRCLRIILLAHMVIFSVVFFGIWLSGCTLVEAYLDAMSLALLCFVLSYTHFCNGSTEEETIPKADPTDV